MLRLTERQIKHSEINTYKPYTSQFENVRARGVEKGEAKETLPLPEIPMLKKILRVFG